MNLAGEAGLRPRPCQSCQTAVYDLLHARTGKPAPIEARTSTNGNIVVDLAQGTYRVLSGPALELARTFGDAAVLHVNHFASCPSAATWRARSAAKKRPG